MSARRAGLWILIAVARHRGRQRAAPRVPSRPRSEAVASRPAPGSVLRALPVDRALEDRILALDPEHITADDVRDTLANAPRAAHRAAARRHLSGASR